MSTRISTTTAYHAQSDDQSKQINQMMKIILHFAQKKILTLNSSNSYQHSNKFLIIVSMFLQIVSLIKSSTISSLQTYLI